MMSYMSGYILAAVEYKSNKKTDYRRLTGREGGRDGLESSLKKSKIRLWRACPPLKG
jgi:hypothetical protein